MVSPFFKRIIKLEKRGFDWNYWIILLFLVFGLVLSYKMDDKLFLAFYIGSIVAVSVALIWREVRR